MTKEDKYRSGIDDEEKVFIESKILLEELRQSTAQLTDYIMMKQENIEVRSTSPRQSTARSSRQTLS